MSPQEVQDTLRMNEYTSGEQFISQDTVTGGDASCPVKSFDMNVLRSNNPIEDSHAEAIIRLGSKVPTYFSFENNSFYSLLSILCTSADEEKF